MPPNRPWMSPLKSLHRELQSQGGRPTEIHHIPPRLTLQETAISWSTNWRTASSGGRGHASHAASRPSLRRHPCSREPGGDYPVSTFLICWDLRLFQGARPQDGAGRLLAVLLRHVHRLHREGEQQGDLAGTWPWGPPDTSGLCLHFPGWGEE